MTFDKSPGFLPLLLAAALGVASIAPYLEFNGQLILEPDVQLPAIRLYYEAIRTWSLTPLSVPWGNPYFEGQCVIYALAIHAFDTLHGLFSADPSSVAANFDDIALVAIRCVNALARVLATVVFFATVRRLTDRTWAAAVLTFMFACSPQIFAIDLERIDHFMILPLVIILHISLAIARGEAGWRHGAILGIAIAVVSSTKMSGFLFGGFAAIAMVVAVTVHRKSPGIWRRQGVIMAGAAAAGLPVLALLMIRYVIHWQHFPAVVRAGYFDQMMWTAVFSYTPRFYYNVDLFAENGWFYLALTGACAAVVIHEAVVRRAAAAIWLSTSLAVYSALGFFAFKYDRGGYHLVPLYLYVLALAIGVIHRHAAEGSPARRKAVTAFVIAALAIPIGVAATAFAKSAEIAFKRSDSVMRTRLAAREWIIARFSPGMRICLPVASQWASPKLKGLGFHVTSRLFDFPYLSAAAMADYVAPSLAQVRAGCDAVVFNDFHKRLYVHDMRFQGHEERAREWEGLYQALAANFPPTTFAAETPAYLVKSVEVFDLRQPPVGEGPEPAGSLFRSAARDGFVEGDSIQFGTTSVRIVPGRYAGRIDVAQTFANGTLAVWGWAADTSTQMPAAGVLLVVGSKVVDYDATGTDRRPDVMKAFANPRYVLTGFASCAPVPTQPAEHVRVFAVGSDGTAGELEPKGGSAITSQDLAPPAFCLSNEG